MAKKLHGDGFTVNEEKPDDLPRPKKPRGSKVKPLEIVVDIDTGNLKDAIDNKIAEVVKQNQLTPEQLLQMYEELTGKKVKVDEPKPKKPRVKKEKPAPVVEAEPAVNPYIVSQEELAAMQQQQPARPRRMSPAEMHRMEFENHVAGKKQCRTMPFDPHAKRINKFEKSPYFNAEKSDIAIDKKLSGGNAPPPRTRPSADHNYVTVRCSVCGTIFDIFAEFLSPNSQPRCEVCSGRST